MNFEQLKRFLAAGAVSGAMIAGAVYAGEPGPVEVSLSQVQAQAGDTVILDFDFVGNGDSRGWEGDINYDATGIANIDLSDCLEGSNTFIPSCTFPSDGDHTGGVIRIGIFTDPDPLADFTGQIVVELDGSLDAGDVIEFSWSALEANSPDAPVEATAGSITIVEETGPDLVVDPDFGPVPLGEGAAGDTLAAGGNVANNGSEAGTFSCSLDDATGVFGVSPDLGDVTVDAGDDVDFEISCALPGDADEGDTFAADLNCSGDLEGTHELTCGVEVSDPEPNLVVNPPFGPVPLGNGSAGDTLSANGSVVNEGTADGNFSCSLTDDGGGVFSVSPDLSDITLGPDEGADFSVSCALPADGEEGDSFSGTIMCEGDLNGTHELSCGVSEFEPLPVPTMQKWSLILFALMMLIAGGIGVRFFRA